MPATTLLATARRRLPRARGALLQAQCLSGAGQQLCRTARITIHSNTQDLHSLHRHTDGACLSRYIETETCGLSVLATTLWLHAAWRRADRRRRFRAGDLLQLGWSTPLWGHASSSAVSLRDMHARFVQHYGAKCFNATQHGLSCTCDGADAPCCTIEPETRHQRNTLLASWKAEGRINAARPR